eukprot:365692-Chlamydomonas_euryale.AAC.5
MRCKHDQLGAVVAAVDVGGHCGVCTAMWTVLGAFTCATPFFATLFPPNAAADIQAPLIWRSQRVSPQWCVCVRGGCGWGG